ncbi:MAG TPA: response regulator [Candidatus Saccharimonadales bacterium]|nr:response regulator [Candidatus Saccharimonadales bacterium]
MAKTILVVEDDTELQAACKAMLEQFGFIVLQATNGKDGLIQFVQGRPDAVLLDISMPEVDGVSMLQALRAQESGASTPVIVLTNDGSNLAVHQELNNQVQAYFIKSKTSLETVVAALNKVLP